MPYYSNCNCNGIEVFTYFILKKIRTYLRWLDWIFLSGYLPRLSINHVGMSKDNNGKKVTTTVLYKDENISWSGFYCNRSRHGNIMTPLRFLFIFVFLCTRSFLKKPLKGVCTFHIILLSITRTMFWALKKSGKKPSTGVRNIKVWISYWRVVGV